jgi:histidinol-phosphate aminotransferase
MAYLKKHLANIKRTESTHLTRVDKIRMDKNERTFPFPDKILHDFKEKIHDGIFTIYPELGPLYTKLAQCFRLNRDNIFLTHGSDIAIKTVYENYVSEGDNILITNPSYAMSAVYASLFNCKITEVSYNGQFKINQDYFLSQISKNIKLVILESPNSFGEDLDLEFIKKVILETHKNHTLLLIDEAYFSFHFQSQHVQDFINIYDNLIITRTFSKYIGIPSARIGCLISNPTRINELKRFKPMHEISGLSALLAEVCLDNLDLIKSHVNSEMVAARNFMLNSFKKLDYKVSHSNANFVVVDLNLKDQKSFEIDCEKNHILIGKKFSYLSDYNFYRLTVVPIDQFEIFLTILSRHKK